MYLFNFTEINSRYDTAIFFTIIGVKYFKCEKVKHHFFLKTLSDF